MIEKIIYLGAIDPLHIYGVNNAKLEIIKDYFPKLKIIARGCEIKAIGDEEQIQQFENKIHRLIEHLDRFNKLSEQDIKDHISGSSDTMRDLSKEGGVLVYGNNGKPIRATTIHQKMMVKKYKQNDLLFAIGPAGSGKTYIAVALAVRALRNREVKRIILSRPAVEAGEHLGFLPGDLKEKLDPYLQPLYDALNDMFPPRKLAELIEDKIVQIAPLAFMRGRTLNDAFVVLDEAQNASVNQLKMFLTRMGENAKFIVTGDITQIDLPRKKQSGLLQCQRILRDIDGISIIRFGTEDIVRHRLVKSIVDAYDKEAVKDDKKTEKDEKKADEQKEKE